MEEWLGIELIDAYGLVVYMGVDKTKLNMNYYYNKKIWQVFLNKNLHTFNYNKKYLIYFK